VPTDRRRDGARIATQQHPTSRVPLPAATAIVTGFSRHALERSSSSSRPWDGRQLAAVRALAGLGIRELAAAASVAVRTLHCLETGGSIQVAEKKRHGCVQRDLWGQIVAALAGARVELLPQGASFGAGGRWTAPRERRRSDA
jgi:hypothetical protein